jgi:acyl carrier protein
MNKLSSTIAFAVGIGAVASSTAFAQFAQVETRCDIGDRVKEIVMEHLGAQRDKVTENASLTNDLGADSLDKVELLMAVEEEFGCEIPDEVCDPLTVVEFIKSIKSIEQCQCKVRSSQRVNDEDFLQKWQQIQALPIGRLGPPPDPSKSAHHGARKVCKHRAKQ